MKIAVDNQIHLRVVEKLRENHTVLWSADRKDEDWIDDALDQGVSVFISPDLDVPNYLDRIGSDAVWIDVPQGLKKNGQLEFIENALRKINL